MCIYNILRLLAEFSECCDAAYIAKPRCSLGTRIRRMTQLPSQAGRRFYEDAAPEHGSVIGGAIGR
jgi:hypothetical protein